MAFTGGDLLEINYKHPTLGTGTLYPKSGEEFTVELGGFKANDDSGMITGDGQFIDQINRKRWEADGTVAWDSEVADEVNQMNLLAADPVLADWTFTHVNGTIWGGNGKPVGDIKGDAQKAQMKVKIAGGGKLIKL
jgi:hypothetical protein